MGNQTTQNIVTVDTSKLLRPIRMMNAVNNGPSKARSDQTCTNFDEYKVLEIPYARIHDAAHCHAYGGWHSTDITGIFPDFDKDADDPDSYDFTLTDEYLEIMRSAGTEPFFRLGQSIEHWIKKYGVNPPKDPNKWASICEHIIRHYNEGWANGFHWNITYWEIWNEPDNGPAGDGRQSPTWTGTPEQFYELYRITACRLKQAFPNLKIGGPSLSWSEEWADKFLANMQANHVPIDFFSWHCYTTNPKTMAQKTAAKQALLDKYGYGDAESILNEWNYVRGWSDEWIYSLDVENGSMNYKSAAFIAACMSVEQDTDLDMLMFYDARVSCGMNSMFSTLSKEPLHGYYPFVAWKKLRRLGTEVDVCLNDIPNLYATAAIDKHGKLGILITRYCDDDNISATAIVRLKVPGRAIEHAVCHVTDKLRMYTEIFPVTDENGALILKMKPNSFMFIELND